MTTAYTSLLGLALPVTGELSGTWGDTVNNSITSLLDSAVAGTTTLSSDADVTLTTTTGSANTAREAILLWTAGGTATRTITAPAQSKVYIVINASSSTQSIKLVGAGPTTGVTIVKGESALCAWNGSDFIKISNISGAGLFTSITNSGLTSGRVVYSTTGGLETDSANLTFNGTTLTANTLNLTNQLGVAYGGTGLTSGTSGGVLYYSATGTLASSAALAANAIVLGGGAGATPATTTTGTGVVTALGVNTGTAGAFVVNGGALGTPSSGTVTNLTGTASININGTVGATTANTGAFTTITATTSIAINSVAVPTISSTSTLTNKWIQPRVLASTANSATPTLNTDSYDMMVITGQSVAITSFSTNLTGTPVNGQKLIISITGTGAIAITWGASFESSTVTLPSTTVTTNRLDVGFIWNVATSKWRCVASA